MNPYEEKLVHNQSFSLLAAAGGEQKEKKKFFGDTPITCPPGRVPGKGLAALGNPASTSLS